jgi:hypothetical protein
MRGRPNDVITRCADETIFSAEENVLKQKAEGSTALLQIHSRCPMEPTNPIILRQQGEQDASNIENSIRSLSC